MKTRKQNEVSPKVAAQIAADLARFNAGRQAAADARDAESARLLAVERANAAPVIDPALVELAAITDRDCQHRRELARARA